MKTNLNSQNIGQMTTIELENNPLAGVTASHALVTNVALASGKQTSIVTLFNQSEIKFEEVNIGVGYTLSYLHYINWISRQSTLYSLKEGKLKYQTEFQIVYRKQRNAS